MKKLNLVLPFLFLISCILPVFGANWYVDSSIATSGNGTSWSSAWKNVSNVGTISAGDTVYISGGPSGSSQTYSVSNWQPKGGTTTSPITYKIGQDVQHNGTVIFNGTGFLLGSINNVVISGDAGDGASHFATTTGTNNASSFAGIISTTSSAHIRISYLNCGKMNGGGLSPFYFGQGSCTAIELDHIYIYITGAPSQGGFSALWNGNAAGYDQSKCHHNEVHLPNDANGVGPDGLKWQQNGCSIYNNLFVTYFQTGASGDHQDGDQVQGGDYNKVYNNIIIDMANYGIFFQGSYGGFNHLRIYNNIVILTSSAIRASAPPGGIVVGAAGPSTFNDVLIANNVTVDYGGHAAIAFNNQSGSSANFTASLVANNSTINGGSPNLTGNTTTPQQNNVLLSSATASTYYILYSLSNPNNDFHLKSTATPLIGTGVNLTSWGITTDMDGNPRPATGAWDIGPYQYSTNVIIITNTTPVISVSPTSLVFGSITTNTGVSQNITVSNSGNGILTGTATVSAPFSILSGSSYNLNANQSQIINVGFLSSNAGIFNGTVLLTGGLGTSVSVSGTTTNLIITQPTNVITITNYVQVYLTNVVQIFQTNTIPVYITNYIPQIVLITNTVLIPQVNVYTSFVGTATLTPTGVHIDLLSTNQAGQ